MGSIVGDDLRRQQQHRMAIDLVSKPCAQRPADVACSRPGPLRSRLNLLPASIRNLPFTVGVLIADAVTYLNYVEIVCSTVGSPVTGPAPQCRGRWSIRAICVSLFNGFKSLLGQDDRAVIRQMILLSNYRGIGSGACSSSA